MITNTDYSASTSYTYSNTSTATETVEASESTLVDTSLDASEVVDATSTETSTDTSGEYDTSDTLDEFVISGNTFTGTSSSGVYSQMISSSSSTTETTETTDEVDWSDLDFDQVKLDSLTSQQSMLSAMFDGSSSSTGANEFEKMSGFQTNGVDFSAIYKANSSFNTLNASKDLMTDYFAD